ncbi:MAG: PqqD family protein [Blastocatellia bacterium]
MKNRREQAVPEARSEGLVVQHLTDELLVYDQDRHKAHCLNHTAALVWRHCDGKNTAADIARKLSRDAKAEVEAEVVWLALDQLSRTRLLKQKVSSDGAGVSRREVMRRIGIGAAVALPLVTSIVAPKASQAANCRPSGAACTAAAQCCSGLCPGAPSGTCA